MQLPSLSQEAVESNGQAPVEDVDTSLAQEEEQKIDDALESMYARE